ncbi:MAG: polysaccharide deacetylase family protein [Actinobacteria bacterium]|nr:polysaccharide deacetylase family protein [Actinomycetota bacterium]
MSSSRVGSVLASVLVVACTKTVPPTASTAPPDPPQVAIVVEGVVHEAPFGTTLGELVHELGLKPRAGRLLSVDGGILEPRIDRGTILLDGEEALFGTVLQAGDVIAVRDGADRVERTRRRAKVLRGMNPGDPQYTLRLWKLRRVETVGRVSGEVASLRYVPIGRPRVSREVALTFDDGPWPRYTRAILKVLERRNVRATFFMVGENVKKWPGIARDVVKAGMLVGNHSWDHPETPAFADLSPHRLRTELSFTNDALRGVGAARPYLFRPPGGSWNDEVVQAAREQGLRVVNWDVDPQDWRASRSPRQIAHLVLSHVRPGSIVDMHDGGGDQSATVKALPLIIRGLRKMGFRIVVIPR